VASSIVVVIDHHRARFFEPDSSGKGLEERGHLQPDDPHGFERHLEHRKEADYRGQRVPEADEYYERIARRLDTAASILLTGEAGGKSSAMRYLEHYLREKHRAIAERITAAEDADLSAATLGDIEGMARSHFGLSP
jgi:hypothetical protein